MPISLAFRLAISVRGVPPAILGVGPGILTVTIRYNGRGLTVPTGRAHVSLSESG